MQKKSKRNVKEMQKKSKKNAKEMQKFISEMQKKCKNSLSSFLQIAVIHSDQNCSGVLRKR